jgi:hypothetical protein
MLVMERRGEARPDRRRVMDSKLFNDAALAAIAVILGGAALVLIFGTESPWGVLAGLALLLAAGTWAGVNNRDNLGHRWTRIRMRVRTHDVHAVAHHRQ